MIRWFMKAVSKGFDVDDEHVNHITIKDVFVGMPFLMMVLFIMTLPVIPLVLVLGIIAEVVLAVRQLVVGIPFFFFVLTLFLIIQGNGTTGTVFLFFGSTLFLIAYFFVLPKIKRSSRYRRITKRLSRVSRI